MKSYLIQEGPGIASKAFNYAKKLIPGGTMLLSKRPEMFLPDQWPSYFSKSSLQINDLISPDFLLI